ncbi:MAG: hypothetical protein AB1489_29670 [Acidobacteriota bacterium]
MKDSKELRRYMKAIGTMSQDGQNHHLSEEELIDYRQGRCAIAEQKSIQLHLVECDACVATYKSVCDFFDPSQQDEQPISDIELHKAWKDLLPKVEAQVWSPVSTAKPAQVEQQFFTRKLILQAAALIIAFLLPGLWAFSQWQARRQSEQRWQAEQERLTQRLVQIEQENRHLQERINTGQQSDSLAAELKKLTQENHQLQEQATAIKQNYETELAQLRQPQINIPIFDLLPQDAAVRSNGEEDLKQIELSPSNRGFMLILNGSGLPKYPQYNAEIVDSKGQRAWQTTGLQQQEDNNFYIKLDRTFLASGKYQIKLYGGGKAIASYLINIKSQ